MAAILARVQEQLERQKRNNVGPLGRPDQKRRQTTLPEAESRGKNGAGDIVYKGPHARMPLPNIGGDDPAKKPCGAYYREGSVCRFGDKCRFSHVPIDKLEPDS